LRSDSSSAYAALEMAQPASLDPHIVDSLYHKALALSDAVRSKFTMVRRLELASESEDLARIALSCEGLRTTTRMLHAVAWLLNQRSFLNGDLTEFQLKRCGHLPPGDSGPNPQRLAMLNSDVQELIVETDQFYARLLRLDNAWREQATPNGDAALQMQVRA
jgi:regulator of CtrA degradation